MESDPYVNQVILNSFNITFLPFTLSIGIALFCTLILLIISALVSGSEVAFFSLNPSEIEKIKTQKSTSAKKVLQLLDNPQKLLATILIANNFVNIGVVVLSTYITNLWIDFSHALWLGMIFQVVIITFLLLLFGEIIPKVYANKFSYKFSHFMALPLVFFSKIFSPISYVLMASIKQVDKKINKKNENISKNQLSDALDLTTEIAEDKEILKGIIEFGSIEASEIMCSRLDVTAIEIETPFENIITQITEAGYSRIPVYEQSFDHIKGILYIKDLLPHIHKENSFKWQTLIRSPHFIPENKKINELLQELQAKRIHMAIVVDEYGGTSGIITMEDILEEIVGEITDEFDVNDIHYAKINENNYLFEGKTLLNDIYKILDLENNFFDEIRGDADTLAGLILELKGEFPKVYDIIKYKQFAFTIEEIDNRRIKKIKITIVPDFVKK